MLNSENYEDILACTPDESKAKLAQCMIEPSVSFANITEFPSIHGLYFILLNEEILYIGKADTQTIQVRCRQYISPRDSGGTLRKKIECVKKCSPQDVVDYITSNLCAKFITSIEVTSLKVVEEIAIWAFHPKLNAIKPTSFQYDRLKVV